jgi:hypothetical protein
MPDFALTPIDHDPFATTGQSAPFDEELNRMCGIPRDRLQRFLRRIYGSENPARRNA